MLFQYFLCKFNKNLWCIKKWGEGADGTCLILTPKKNPMLDFLEASQIY